MTATPSSLPIACSLTAGAAGDRKADWQALLARALISCTSMPDGVRIELQNLPGGRSIPEQLLAGGG